MYGFGYLVFFVKKEVFKLDRGWRLVIFYDLIRRFCVLIIVITEDYRVLEM